MEFRVLNNQQESSMTLWQTSEKSYRTFRCLVSKSSFLLSLKTRCMHAVNQKIGIFFCHWKLWWGFWLDCFMSKTIINYLKKSPSKKLDSFWHYSKWWPQVLNLFFLLHSSFPKHETFRYAFMVFFLWTQSILKSKPTAADSKNGHINSGKLWNTEQEAKQTCFAFVLQLILSYNKNKVDYLPWLRTPSYQDKNPFSPPSNLTEITCSIL